MKNIYLSLITLIIAGNILAQIQITQSDLPSAGSVYHQRNSLSLIGLDFSSTGANHTWDFSNLSGNGSIDTVAFVSVGSTPLAYQLFFNNALIYPSTKSDLAAPADDITPALPSQLPIQSPIKITNVINYFKKNSSEYTITGFGAAINNVPSSTRYNPTDELYQLPLNYNDTYSGAFQWNISVPGVGYYGQDKQRETVVDGWGTLTLPNNATYDVLRLKSTVSGTDSIHVNQFSIGFGLPSTEHEYKWLAKTEGLPVLEIHTREALGGEQVTSVKYKYTQSTVGIKPPAPVAESSVDVFPVPASDKLTVNLSSINSKPVRINIVDMAGRTLMSKHFNYVTEGMNQFSLSLELLPQGIYQVVLQQDSYQNSVKFIRQ